MPAAHHATRQLKLVLDSLRRGQPLVDPAALALPFIRHRYQNEHVHTAATVEADLRTALATLVQRRLDALRGDSSGTPHAHTAEDLAETLRRDFSTPDIDRQAIACLYYRYLLPRPWKVKEIGAVVSPHAVDSPRELNQRLEERMRLLSRVSRRIGKHLKPLAAALDASYRLLSPSEQIALARLAVFHGPFSLAAARTVCAPSGDAKVGYDVGDAAVDRDADTDADADADSLPSRTHRPPVPAIDGADVPRLIDALAGKSLLRVAEDDASGERRFALLDTLREYGGQRLRKLGSGKRSTATGAMPTISPTWRRRCRAPSRACRTGRRSSSPTATATTSPPRCAGAWPNRGRRASGCAWRRPSFRIGLPGAARSTANWP